MCPGPKRIVFNYSFIDSSNNSWRNSWHSSVLHAKIWACFLQTEFSGSMGWQLDNHNLNWRKQLTWEWWGRLSKKSFPGYSLISPFIYFKHMFTGCCSKSTRAPKNRPLQFPILKKHICVSGYSLTSLWVYQFPWVGSTWKVQLSLECFRRKPSYCRFVFLGPLWSLGHRITVSSGGW